MSEAWEDPLGRLANIAEDCCTLNDADADALRFALTRIAALEAELAEAKAQLEFDRTTCADFITALDKAMDGRFWLTEGRGSYAWNDDRYRDEFRDAAVELRAVIDPMRKMAANLKSSPRTTKEVHKARVDLKSELAEARKDTKRLEFWFSDGPAPEAAQEYLREKLLDSGIPSWSVDRWRHAIDAAMAKGGAA